MDWILKASPWELTEFGRDDFPLLTVSSCTEGNKNMELFPVDQGFNRLGNGIVKETTEQKELAQETLSPSGASRRTRGHSGHSQHTSCLVDGCTSDLSSCKDYHRRHRVCELHSKTPVVVIRGKEQRFCQQCSRFHSLGEFDEVKRSCRKRLDGHNRRRRKPHPESLFSSYGNFLANQQGAKLLQFNSPQSNTTTHGSNLIWHNEDKFNQELHVIVQQSISSNSKRHVYSRSGNNFPFLLGKGNQPVPEFSVSQQIHDGHASPNCLKKISGNLTPLDKSKGAPSLLSHIPTQTPGTCSSHLMQHDVIHMNQPTGTSLQFDGPAPYLQQRSQDLSGVFHFGHEGLFENEALQLISFSCNYSTKVIDHYQNHRSTEEKVRRTVQEKLGIEYKSFQSANDLQQMAQWLLERKNIEQLDVTDLARVENKLAAILRKIQIRKTQLMLDAVKTLQDEVPNLVLLECQSRLQPASARIPGKLSSSSLMLHF